ncbi:beta-lactamase hydrolase domain-containing protein [Psychrobacter immobilis]|uniref:beta-lactamase hydrolase domain-containing protein n=1 Tax=Psychrobacter immobilis TaxID=498 RepID=UPI001917DC37|nr:sulfur transferase domain-containing protein [Psychrobacter immobilis]
MTSQKNATSTEQSDSSIITDATAANDSSANETSANDSAPDNGIDLTTIFDPYFRPDANTIVCGALDEEKVIALAKAGVELVVNLQPDDELSFDESAAVERAGMHYEHLAISGAADLKQLKILAFDNILRQHHGKKIVVHCGSGNRVGAAIALRAGWLRGRKMDTAMERGRSHGLTKLEDEVFKRLLVPR